jgi:RNA polymerase sigma-32 factor
MPRAAITLPSSENLTRYIQQTRTFPLLGPEEEHDLAIRWRDQKDADASHTLVTSHLRLVTKIAINFRGYGLPVSDLISVGNMGLMQAVNKFDPDRGFRFATYALWWIRAAIQEYVLHSWSLVKMGTTPAQKKLFFNLRKLKGQMEELESGDLSTKTVTAIARELDVPEAEVIEMNRRLGGRDNSLNARLKSDSESDWLDLLLDEGPNQEATVGDRLERVSRLDLLEGALAKLSERERIILMERRLKDEPTTFEALSKLYGVSRERIRQVEVRAFEKLQKAMKAAEREATSRRANGRATTNSFTSTPTQPAHRMGELDADDLKDLGRHSAAFKDAWRQVLSERERVILIGLYLQLQEPVPIADLAREQNLFGHRVEIIAYEAMRKLYEAMKAAQSQIAVPGLEAQIPNSATAEQPRAPDLRTRAPQRELV